MRNIMYFYIYLISKISISLCSDAARSVRHAWFMIAYLAFVMLHKIKLWKKRETALKNNDKNNIYNLKSNICHIRDTIFFQDYMNCQPARKYISIIFFFHAKWTVLYTIVNFMSRIKPLNDDNAVLYAPYVASRAWTTRAANSGLSWMNPRNAFSVLIKLRSLVID